jgi:hypothetical protein
MEDQKKLDRPEFVEGFALSGEYVSNLKDKGFTIKNFRYEESEDLDNPSRMRRKLILSIELTQTKELIDYYPNKTSQRVIIGQKGYTFKNWIGFKGKFKVENQKVGKDMKQVIYIQE